MRLLKILLVPVLIGFQICHAQTYSNPETLHIEEFNWTVTLPENFTPLKKDEWGKLIKKDVAVFGEGILSEEFTIFSYVNNKSNKLDAVWQPYDAKICGDYRELNAEANEVMHQMYESQLPGGEFDSISKTQTISGLEFKRFDVTIDFPDVIKMKITRFYRLFEDKQFNIYIMAIDEKIGQKMLAAILESKFE